MTPAKLAAAEKRDGSPHAKKGSVARATPSSVSRAPAERRKLWIDVHEVAARYDIAPELVRVWARQGVIPSGVVFSERVTRWSVAALDAHDAELLAKEAQRAA
ncbi:hypothetical protein [Variovorax sp. Sphag1AA]|uniref:hypothetical protein n=1 Tax=Variovorax sp. Sphag1AA TaxID=2587027 RepID=UPI0016128DA7|nr:hypothetical protein [Variovorax sp. Sphag1AA]MBB3180096.1 hypothetical protein [Variovorax sp. Sphag1AA]